MSESKQFLNIIRIFDPDQQTELIEIMKQYNFDEIIDVVEPIVSSTIF